jgi:hypothetical protein
VISDQESRFTAKAIRETTNPPIAHGLDEVIGDQESEFQRRR